ncbi:hypothetical protein pb186bvf_012866 [Paramecium bursaria]
MNLLNLYLSNSPDKPKEIHIINHIQNDFHSLSRQIDQVKHSIDQQTLLKDQLLQHNLFLHRQHAYLTNNYQELDQLLNIKDKELINIDKEIKKLEESKNTIEPCQIEEIDDIYPILKERVEMLNAENKDLISLISFNRQANHQLIQKEQELRQKYNDQEIQLINLQNQAQRIEDDLKRKLQLANDLKGFMRKKPMLSAKNNRQNSDIQFLETSLQNFESERLESMANIEIQLVDSLGQYIDSKVELKSIIDQEKENEGFSENSGSQYAEKQPKQPVFRFSTTQELDERPTHRSTIKNKFNRFESMKAFTEEDEIEVNPFNSLNPTTDRLNTDTDYLYKGKQNSTKFSDQQGRIVLSDKKQNLSYRSFRSFRSNNSLSSGYVYAPTLKEEIEQSQYYDEIKEQQTEMMDSAEIIDIQYPEIDILEQEEIKEVPINKNKNIMALGLKATLGVCFVGLGAFIINKLRK